MSALSASRLRWYARRAARMSPAEVLWRARDKARQAAWSRRQVGRGQPVPDATALTAKLTFPIVLPPEAAAMVPETAGKALLAAADHLLKGEWEVLGTTRTDMVLPDWFHDPVTGQRAPADRYAFRINHRSQAQTGNVKQIWEVSRLQHLTLLAAAWFVSRDDVYARRVAEQLRSWWRENPFLSGVNWTSGIEVALRLISMVWIRRLMNDWPEIAGLFEHEQLAVRQIRWHQQYLAAFTSRGSSANNHVIAEAAGQTMASCAFAWFPESESWRRTSAELLERELLRNTFPSGIDRELASDYQSFVAELGLLAAIESGSAGYPLSPEVWQRLCAMIDSGAALLDERMRPPRQGDGDEGRALLLDAPAANRWPTLLALAASVAGRLDWWPPVEPDGFSTLVGAMPDAVCIVPDRPARPAMALRRCRDDPAPHDKQPCPGDLVPVRRRFARLSQHRRARACRCALGRGAVRRCRYIRRSRHLLLSRRAGVAFILPVDDCAQHARGRRPESVGRRRRFPLAAARERDGHRRRGRRRCRRVDGRA